MRSQTEETARRFIGRATRAARAGLRRLRTITRRPSTLSAIGIAFSVACGLAAAWLVSPTGNWTPYYFSTLLEAFATLLGVVVTALLVGAQLGASAFGFSAGPRRLLKDRFVWTSLGLYGLVVGLSAMGLLLEEVRPPLILRIVAGVDAGIAAAGVLLTYALVRHVISHLDPVQVLLRLTHALSTWSTRTEAKEELVRVLTVLTDAGYDEWTVGRRVLRSVVPDRLSYVELPEVIDTVARSGGKYVADLYQFIIGIAVEAERNQRGSTMMFLDHLCRCTENQAYRLGLRMYLASSSSELERSRRYDKFHRYSEICADWVIGVMVLCDAGYHAEVRRSLQSVIIPSHLSELVAQLTQDDAGRIDGEAPLAVLRTMDTCDSMKVLNWLEGKTE